ncbi:hypothetical protein LOTGIDRAFT_153696 [Lottia gigantea]|uniref:C-type lectin domain-containing protein n=1 Tax=Lottia gigantea TaxID=225164 RepID=V4A3F8_LOTGI|nr:hypothetical protein LOTGIDRAFT_153696 [Lottia gigantea]ESO91267.1 hypothetical protein LOTGIDRAFT_153696 [Lottia gigantea]
MNDSLSFQYNVASKQCGVHVGRFRSAVMPIQDPNLLIYWTYYKNCREDLGYTFYPDDNTCVKFHSVKKSWMEANLVCDTEYGHMYLVNSLDKFDLLKTVLNAEGIANGFFYLGGTDQFMEGQFSWLDGSTYTNFQGSPNNENGEEHCFGYRAYERGLYDITCTKPLKFLCEIPILPK